MDHQTAEPQRDRRPRAASSSSPAPAPASARPWSPPRSPPSPAPAATGSRSSSRPRPASTPAPAPTSPTRRRSSALSGVDRHPRAGPVPRPALPRGGRPRSAACRRSTWPHAAEYIAKLAGLPRPGPGGGGGRPAGPLRRGGRDPGRPRRDVRGAGPGRRRRGPRHAQPHRAHPRGPRRPAAASSAGVVIGSATVLAPRDPLDEQEIRPLRMPGEHHLAGADPSGAPRQQPVAGAQRGCHGFLRHRHPKDRPAVLAGTHVYLRAGRVVSGVKPY